jgi:hypothetical protein
MRFVSLVSLIVLSAATAAAQSASPSLVSGAPGVTITDISWRQEVFIPALYDDPMRVNQDKDDLERDRKATSVENANRAKQGQTAIPDPAKKIASNTPVGSTPMGMPIGDAPAGNQNLPAKTDPGLASVHYVYKAKVKNAGEKDIRIIQWQYVLSDRSTGEPVGSHSFTTPVNLRAGRSLELIGKSKTGPARLVDARNGDKEIRGKYAERVIIEGIEYADGTFWQQQAP